MDPPPSRTPTRLNRLDGEIPDSQDDDEQQSSSDSEDLQEEEAHPPTLSLPAAEQDPARVHNSSHQKGKAVSTLPLPLPSTVAHSLPVTTPPVNVEADSRIQPQLQNAPSQATSTSISASPPANPPSSTNPKTLHLQSQIATLHTKISDRQAQLTLSNAQLPNPEHADAIVKAHIKLLHEYNEIKDVGLGLMGLIADGRGVRLGGVMEEFGVSEKD